MSSATVGTSSATTDVEPTQPALTRVNGIGQWNAWTRNFNSPLLALLDLFDNSVDAAMKPMNDDGEDYTGRIEVESDWWNRSYSDGDDSDDDDDDYSDVDGAPMDLQTKASWERFVKLPSSIPLKSGQDPVMWAW